MDILGRVDIPNLDNVPDSLTFDNGKPARYQIAGTPLDIVRIENGAREGEFLFSGQTVEVAPRFFRGVAKLPLRSKLPITSWETTIARITGPLIPSFIV